MDKRGSKGRRGETEGRKGERSIKGDEGQAGNEGGGEKCRKGEKKGMDGRKEEELLHTKNTFLLSCVFSTGAVFRRSHTGLQAQSCFLSCPSCNSRPLFLLLSGTARGLPPVYFHGNSRQWAPRTCNLVDWPAIPIGLCGGWCRRPRDESMKCEVLSLEM